MINVLGNFKGLWYKIIVINDIVLVQINVEVVNRIERILRLLQCIISIVQWNKCIEIGNSMEIF